MCDTRSVRSSCFSAKINSDRLWQEIHSTAAYGGIPDSFGMARLALADEDKLARDYFCSRAKLAGLDVAVDEMGNVFAVLEAVNNSIPPIGLGSHLDTQPRGTRFTSHLCIANEGC